MEKLKPHYSLAEIKQAFASPAALSQTFVSKQGADALKLDDAAVDDAAVVAVIQSLGNSDFDKFMTSHADGKIWQDVYRPKLAEIELYVKFTLDAKNSYLLISFKRA